MEKEKIKGKRKRKQNLHMITGFLHYCTLFAIKFLFFSTMPISVEPVILIRIANAICLMVVFAIHAFEDMRT